jgi:hypothetical protein
MTLGNLLDAIGGLSFLAGAVLLVSNSPSPPARSSAAPVAVAPTASAPTPLPVPAVSPRSVMQAYGVTPAEIDTSRAPDLSQPPEQRSRPYLKPPQPKCLPSRAEMLDAFQTDVRNYRRWYGDVAEFNLKGVFGQRYESVRRVAMGESNEELPEDYVKGYRAAHERPRCQPGDPLCPVR